MECFTDRNIHLNQINKFSKSFLTGDMVSATTRNSKQTEQIENPFRLKRSYDKKGTWTADLIANMDYEHYLVESFATW